MVIRKVYRKYHGLKWIARLIRHGNQKGSSIVGSLFGLCASFDVYGLLERFMRFWRTLCVKIFVYGLFVRFMRDSNGLCASR